MSKTLFNQNTFQSKNVTNSDDVQDLKVDTFKATTLTATTIINTELQAATAGVATNTSAITTNTAAISANASAITTNASAITANTTAIGVNATAITANATAIGVNATAITANTTAIGVNATAIGNKQDIISSGTPLQIEVDSDEVSALLATSAGATNFGLITGNILNTELSSKQDNITVSNGIQKSSNDLSLTGSYAGSFDITGTDFKIWNTTRGGSGTSDGRALVHTGSGTKASSVLRINYNDDFGGGTQIDSITGIGTAPDASYDLKVNGNTDIGGVLSIDGYANVKTALDSASGGGTYTAATNGGLAVSGNAFSIDLTNTNATFEIPQKVRIEEDNTPQLLVEPASATGTDAEVEIRGARNGSTAVFQSRLIFSNYDSDLGGTNKLGCWRSKVTNHSTNIGGLILSNYANGSTRTGQLTLSAAGNFNMGGGSDFQDTYKLQVTGDSKMIGSNYIKPQLRHFAYDKDDTFSGGNWGNGSTQVNVISDRRVGDSFCSEALGVITLSKNGYYRIKVSAQTQSDGYNDRVSFMNYLRIGGTDYDENQNYNFFGWIYIRNNTDGGHGSVMFEDYIYLTSSTTIQPRHKLETTSDRNFNNTLPQANIDNFLNITIERIYDEDPEV